MKTWSYTDAWPNCQLTRTTWLTWDCCAALTSVLRSRTSTFLSTFWSWRSRKVEEGVTWMAVFDFIYKQSCLSSLSSLSSLTCSRRWRFGEARDWRAATVPRKLQFTAYVVLPQVLWLHKARVYACFVAIESSWKIYFWFNIFSAFFSLKHSNNLINTTSFVL